MQYTVTHVPAPVSDISVRPVDTGLGGQYMPNRPGARTIREASPLYVGNRLVTAEVRNRRITVHVGCSIVHTGTLPEAVTERYQVNPWVQQYIADNFADQN